MTSGKASDRLVGDLRRQAEHCRRLGSPMYDDLLTRIAADVSASGPLAELLMPWADRPATDLISLRMLAGVHALVLSGDSPDLAAFYPSVGGQESDGDARWHAFRNVVHRQPVDLAPWLELAPQTNEAGRAAALLGALRLTQRWVSDLPIRLFEIGSSAGINLWVDELPIGPQEPIRSPLPSADHPVRIVERAGADLHPIDPTSTEGRMRLSAYVWPDDEARLERLAAALAVVSERPSVVRQQGAADFVEELTLEPGALTVLWHSMTWLYLSPDDQERITAHLQSLAARATADASLAHITFELDRLVREGEPRCDIQLRITPPDTLEILGDGPAHGVPVVWRDNPPSR